VTIDDLENGEAECGPGGYGGDRVEGEEKVRRRWVLRGDGAVVDSQ
jgi:hypothetical protein